MRRVSHTRNYIIRKSKERDRKLRLFASTLPAGALFRITGACEGTLSCSTCHLIFKKEDYDKLPDKPSDEEMDMLDLAYGLCDTSRLGCQITLTESMDGIVVTIPAQVADARNR
ncbi:hypothetical protein GHT06_014331 [Daphnia sinensis]|uniref:2Fe-2S ferredoxin-type domain-containing protein n=1 Tax=Daphnia sinensis TaxID=1820382 RepID=A0AAD5KTG7_9CRUS|nr:hypothetical protein GHT06_014331 [Daphnia sinensis]